VIGKPGGTIAIVLGTYAARPIRQGQISVRARRSPPAAKSLLSAESLKAPVRPFLQLLSAIVFSPRDDARSFAALTGKGDGQEVTIDFSSRSSSINSVDGPLAVLKFVLDPAAVPGDHYTLDIDGALSSLVGQNGEAVEFEPINNVLTVRAPEDPFTLVAQGTEAIPGGVANFGIDTYEPFPSAGGRITLRYPEELASAPPGVRIDPHYGRATFTVDAATPGKLVIDVRSEDNSFNTVPGRILFLTLPIKASAQVGSEGALTLDPDDTYLLTRRGRKVKLAIASGSLTIR
jgi:hypothetical protein